jgi:hypothetical protein
MKNPTVLVLALIYVVSLSSAAQDKARADGDRVAESRRVSQFELVDGTLVDGLRKLVELEHLHLGIEKILRNKFSDPPIADPRFSVRLVDVTVGDILDAMCQYDHRYAWSADGASLNIYPRAAVEDPSYFLNRNLTRIAVEGIPDPDAALVFLDRELPPPREHFSYIQVGGDVRYEKPWTTSFENLTVRQFINRVAEHMGAQSTWIVQGSKDEMLFTFLRGVFH